MSRRPHVAHTRDLVAAFAAQGTPVDIIQIGNEITYGFLVPVGAIYGGPTGLNWPDFTSLVGSVRGSVRLTVGVIWRLLACMTWSASW